MTFAGNFLGPPEIPKMYWCLRFVSLKQLPPRLSSPNTVMLAPPFVSTPFNPPATQCARAQPSRQGASGHHHPPEERRVHPTLGAAGVIGSCRPQGIYPHSVSPLRYTIQHCGTSRKRSREYVGPRSVDSSGCRPEARHSQRTAGFRRRNL